MVADSSCVDETTGLVHTPEISDFWGRLKPRYSLCFYIKACSVEGSVARESEVNAVAANVALLEQEFAAEQLRRPLHEPQSQTGAVICR